VPHLERALAAILFTDIVGSTESAVRLGDGPWRDLLEQHHRAYGGRSRHRTGER
jgi:class 3 adenylate cyclase